MTLANVQLLIPDIKKKTHFFKWKHLYMDLGYGHKTRSSFQIGFEQSNVFPINKKKRVTK